jgi:hypothetical protein
MYLGIAIGIFAWLQMLIFKAKAPIIPDTLYPWIMGSIVAALGVLQQACLIGKHHSISKCILSKNSSDNFNLFKKTLGLMN